MKSNNLGNLPLWNLNDLYKSPKDPKIKKDLYLIQKESKIFEKKYEKKISKLSSSKLLSAIIELQNIDEKIDRILSYAQLLHSEDLNNEKNKIFLQEMQETITNYFSYLIFFNLEINNLSETKIKKYLQNKKLQKFNTWILNIRTFRKHMLNKDLEKLFTDKSLTSKSAWIKLFDETIATLKFDFKNKKLSSAEILNLMSDQNYNNRKIAAKSIGKVFKENVRIFTIITNTLAKDKFVNDKWRKYPNPVRSRNLLNAIEDDVVEALSKSVTSSYSKLSHRYYSLKAKWFNVKFLNYWDRNAPVPFQNKKIYKWDDAKEIVLKAYSEFDPLFGKIVKKFFENNWIHAPVLKGKSPGAFSASTVPSVHPYILVNYQGKIRDVSTLAHELGHGIHQYLAAKSQGHFNSSTPLTLAETASVFGEMLTFKFLLKNEKNLIKRKALLANKIEDMLNTVVRQISFYEFEKEIHNKRKKSELSVNEICSIWMETQKQSLGPSIKLHEEYKYFWTYIPHFIHSPFYVYAYAFGDCLVNSLYTVYQEGLESFKKKYIDLLKAGGSKRYRELLKPFNLDPSHPIFWEKGISMIESFIDELEEIK